MFCHQCGSGVSDDAATCGSCGADLRAKTEDLGATQPIPVPSAEATIRMAAVTSVPVAGAPAAAPPTPLPPTTIMTPVTSAGGPTPPKPAPTSAPPHARNSAPMVLLFGAAVLLGVAGWGGYQWYLQHHAGDAAAAPVTVAATPATTPAPPPPAAPAADATATPAATPAPDAAAAPAVPVAPAPEAPAAAATITPAQLAAMKKERDAAIIQRDAAMDQVKQLKDDLARAKAAPAAAVTPVPPAGADAARVAQVQKEHDTLRFVIGSRKQLLNDKVIESHLYLLPPPSTVTSINLTQSSEITFDAKSYGVSNPKDVVVIPSSVWENTDYKFSIAGSTVRFTILRPDSFRNFAKYFVLMLE